MIQCEGVGEGRHPGRRSPLILQEVAEKEETMLKTVVKPNSYQDSINLMLLTNKINTLDGAR